MDWSSSVSGAISGGLGIVGSLVNYGLQKKLAAQQNQYNIDMWKMNNEYNSPSAQMRRYEEAGLNPALMYGQVSSGTSSAPPQQVTPDAPGLSREFAELGKAFNIEGLKQAIADTRTKQAAARQAEAAADDAESNNKALRQFRWEYHFNPNTGGFDYDGGVASRSGDNITAKTVYRTVDAMAEAKVMQMLANNYRTNSLLVPRSALISSQMQLNAARRGAIPFANYLAQKRAELLAPQIGMLNYQRKYFPETFWIGNAKNAVQTVTPFVTPFLP